MSAWDSQGPLAKPHHWQLQKRSAVPGTQGKHPTHFGWECLSLNNAFQYLKQKKKTVLSLFLAGTFMSCLVLTRNQLNGNHLQMYLSFIAHDCNCFSPGPQPATGDPGLFYFGIPRGRNGGSGFDTDGKRSVSPGEPPQSCSVSRRALHRSSCYSKTERRPLSETKPGQLVSPRKRHIERRFGAGGIKLQ